MTSSATARPKVVAREVARPPQILPMNADRRLPFQEPHRVRHTQLRWNTQQDMHVIRQRVPFHQLHAVPLTQLPNDSPNPTSHLAEDRSFSILRHPHHVISAILLILLTQVTPRYSVRGRGRVPPDVGRVRSSVRYRGGLRRVPRTPALALRLSVPPLWKRQGVATANGAVAVCGVWPADLGHRGHHLSGHAHAAQDLVSRYVVGDQPEDRHQRRHLAARPGLGQLSDGVGVAAQAATGHGSTGAGPSDRTRRGRRDLVGWARRRAWPVRGEESPGRGGGRGAGPSHRPHPDAARPQWSSRDVAGLCRRGHRARQRRPHRRLGWLHPAESQRVSPPRDVLARRACLGLGAAPAGSTGWSRCSNGGCSAPIKGASGTRIWTTTSTSSRSGSTGVGRSIEASCSSGSFSRPLPWSPCRTDGSSKTAATLVANKPQDVGVT